MTFEIWIMYVGTVLAFMSTPGPSHLLMLSNSATHGLRRSLATAWGDLTANFFQMLAAGFGLAALLTASASALTVIKWLGVAYLLWLGLRMILKASASDAVRMGAQKSASLKGLWLQGFLTSAANPKAVVFFAAFFPQFISADAPFAAQFVILSATYLVIDGVFLTAYGSGAAWIGRKFSGDAKKWIERVGGGFMIGAAVLLGLKTAGER